MCCLQKHGIPRTSLFFQTKFTSIDGQDRPQPLPYDPKAPLAEQVGKEEGGGGGVMGMCTGVGPGGREGTHYTFCRFCGDTYPPPPQTPPQGGRECGESKGVAYGHRPWTYALRFHGAGSGVVGVVLALGL